MERAKRNRAAAKRKFTRKVNVFKEAVDRDGHLAVLQGIFKEVESAFDEVEVAHEDYVKLMDNGKVEEAVLSDSDNYMLVLEREKLKVHNSLLEKSEKHKSDGVKSKIKIKALEPPLFSGSNRDYPNFKADYERLMSDNFGKDPFALRQCLSGDALETVKGVENDYDLMVKRLDTKYGNSRRIVDDILEDLKTLKMVSEGDHKGFINMVNKVERCWLDLKKMNLGKEMNSVHMVSHIERVLPAMQKREWVIVAQDTDDHLLFESLIKFLLKEKEVLEYLNANVRLPKSTVKSVVNAVDVQVSEGVNISESSLRNVIQDLEAKQEKIERNVSQLIHMVSNMTNSSKINQMRDINVYKRC